VPFTSSGAAELKSDECRVASVGSQMPVRGECELECGPLVGAGSLLSVHKGDVLSCIFTSSVVCFFLLRSIEKHRQVCACSLVIF